MTKRSFEVNIIRIGSVVLDPVRAADGNQPVTPPVKKDYQWYEHKMKECCEPSQKISGKEETSPPYHPNCGARLTQVIIDDVEYPEVTESFVADKMAADATVRINKIMMSAMYGFMVKDAKSRGRGKESNE